MASQGINSGAWSDDEHRSFLRGLARFGKGDWKSISEFEVKSRTPKQVATHAQSYFAARESWDQEKKHASGPWTKDEHRLFLEGLEEFGKGNWKRISDFVVTSRNPKQVAGYARRYYAHQQKEEQYKKRPTSFDITNAQSGSH